MTFSFDGRVLTINSGRHTHEVLATGNPWPTSYRTVVTPDSKLPPRFEREWVEVCAFEGHLCWNGLPFGTVMTEQMPIAKEEYIGVALHGRAKLCAGCRTVAAARRREAHALTQREYRARHYGQERLREKLIDYRRAAPLEWRASGNAMALLTGKHQTPWSVETPGDGVAWVVCCEGRPVAGVTYTDMAAAMEAAEEFYRPRPPEGGILP